MLFAIAISTIGLESIQRELAMCHAACTMDNEFHWPKHVKNISLAPLYSNASKFLHAAHVQGMLTYTNVDCIPKA